MHHLYKYAIKYRNAVKANLTKYTFYLDVFNQRWLGISGGKDEE